MGMLTREMIFAADDLKRELVSVPEWGGELFVRMLTGGEREEFEQWFNDEQMQRRYVQEGTARNFRTRLVVLTVCDAEGTRLFTLPDIDALATKSFAPIEQIFQVARRLNRLGMEQEEEELRAVVGESSASRNGDSGSV